MVHKYFVSTLFQFELSLFYLWYDTNTIDVVNIGILISQVIFLGDLEWVQVVLTADPGVRLEDIEDQAPPRRKEHRRVPSTVAIEEVKVR